MGTTADKLNKLLETKAAIKQAIIDKGVDISDTDTFASYPEKIESIQAGGGGYSMADIVNIATNNGLNLSNAFSYWDIDEIDLTGLDTAKASSMYSMFTFSTISRINLSGFNTAKVTSFQNMFNNCKNLTSIDVSYLDTSNASNLSFMFGACSKLSEIDVSSFNISKVTNLQGMFYGCILLTAIDLSMWDIIKCGSLGQLIDNCDNLVDFYPPQNINAAMSLSGSTALSHDSLLRILNNLTTISTTKKLTLGTTNLAKLSDEEKAIATNKGWTLA